MSICLRRREFIAGLGGAAASPLAAGAQQGGVCGASPASVLASVAAEQYDSQKSEFTFD
jgi:hypothetical protein